MARPPDRPPGHPIVGIVVASESDLPVIENVTAQLTAFGIPYELTIASAHRSPNLTRRYVNQAARRGIEVLIAAAGGAAHLAGVLAAETTLPVIGVPVNASPLGGLDALLSTVQMPAGVPVATMGVGRGGAENAAIFAAQILARKYPRIEKKIVAHKQKLERDVEHTSRRLKAQRPSRRPHPT